MSRSDSSSGKGERSSAGSQLYVQTDPALFCIEPTEAKNSTGGAILPRFNYCPTWAGGNGKIVPPPPPGPRGTPPPPALDSGWVLVNYTKGEGNSNSIVVDLAPLGGKAPTAVQCVLSIACVVRASLVPSASLFVSLVCACQDNVMSTCQCACVHAHVCVPMSTCVCVRACVQVRLGSGRLLRLLRPQPVHHPWLWSLPDHVL
jgi:hypothetical protein